MMNGMIRRANVASFFAVTYLIVILQGCAGVGEWIMGTPEQPEAPSIAGLKCAGLGAAAGGMIAYLTKRDVGAGVAAGAAVGFVGCFAKSRQVADYQQTQQDIGYKPEQGEVLKVTDYSIDPSMTTHGEKIRSNAVYYVMGPDPAKEVEVSEIRVIKTLDPQTNEYREIGRTEDKVTVKPGTRQAEGVIDIKESVPKGDYLLIFQVAYNGKTEQQERKLTVA